MIAVIYVITEQSVPLKRILKMLKINFNGAEGKRGIYRGVSYLRHIVRQEKYAPYPFILNPKLSPVWGLFTLNGLRDDT